MPCTSSASAIKQAMMAVDRLYMQRIMCTDRMANRLLGFIHALIAGEAVLSKFQSSLPSEKKCRSQPRLRPKRPYRV